MSDKIHELKIGLDLNQNPDMQPRVDATAQKLYADAAPSIVQVKTDKGNGSGFFIDNDGRIATDAHVVLGDPNVAVVTSAGKWLPARIVALDDINDLAIIQVDEKTPPGTKPAKLGTSNLKPDDPLWGFGHPEGYGDIYVSPGYYRTAETVKDVVNNEGPDVQKTAQSELAAMTPLEQTDAKEYLNRPMFNARVNIQKGDSGGPVMDVNGKVVGLNDMSDLASNSDFTPVEKLQALMTEKKPKFQFTYKQTELGWTLTDISRTDGAVRGPYEDHLASQDSYPNPANASGAQQYYSPKN